MSVQSQSPASAVNGQRLSTFMRHKVVLPAGPSPSRWRSTARNPRSITVYPKSVSSGRASAETGVSMNLGTQPSVPRSRSNRPVRSFSIQAIEPVACRATQHPPLSFLPRGGHFLIAVVAGAALNNYPPSRPLQTAVPLLQQPVSPPPQFRKKQVPLNQTTALITITP